MQTLLSSLVRRRHVMRTTLLFSSLAQKRAGVGVGFRSVLMSAMTDLNLCTQKLPKNFLYCIKLLNQQILHARDVDRPRPPLGPGSIRQAPAHAPCGPPFNCMFDKPRVLYVLYIHVLRRSVQYIMCEVTVL